MALDANSVRGGVETDKAPRSTSTRRCGRISGIHEPAQAGLGSPRGDSSESLVAGIGLSQDCRCLQSPLRARQTHDREQVVRRRRTAGTACRDRSTPTRYETSHSAHAAAQPRLGTRSVHGLLILGVVDHGTRACIVLSALKDKRSLTILLELVPAMYRFGIPRASRGQRSVPGVTALALGNGVARRPLATNRCALSLAERTHRASVRHFQGGAAGNRDRRWRRSTRKVGRVSRLVQPCATASAPRHAHIGRGVGQQAAIHETILVAACLGRRTHRLVLSELIVSQSEQPTKWTSERLSTGTVVREEENRPAEAPKPPTGGGFDRNQSTERQSTRAKQNENPRNEARRSWRAYVDSLDGTPATHLHPDLDLGHGDMAGADVATHQSGTAL